MKGCPIDITTYVMIIQYLYDSYKIYYESIIYLHAIVLSERVCWYNTDDSDVISCLLQTSTLSLVNNKRKSQLNVTVWLN